jgi:hypothetical protein
MRYISQYFENGTLPEPGTVCTVDLPVFLNGSAVLQKSLGQHDYELLEAWQYISHSFQGHLFRI